MDEDMQGILIKDLLNIGQRQDEYEWQSFREGVEIVKLYQDEITGGSSALLRYQPGASVPMHKHIGAEYILVLDGSQSDGFREYYAGSMMISYAGITHAISSKNGCIVLAVWAKPVQFTGQE